MIGDARDADKATLKKGWLVPGWDAHGARLLLLRLLAGDVRRRRLAKSLRLSGGDRADGDPPPPPPLPRGRRRGFAFSGAPRWGRAGHDAPAPFAAAAPRRGRAHPRTNWRRPRRGEPGTARRRRPPGPPLHEGFRLLIGPATVGRPPRALSRTLGFEGGLRGHRRALDRPRRRRWAAIVDALQLAGVAASATTMVIWLGGAGRPSLHRHELAVAMRARDAALHALSFAARAAGSRAEPDGTSITPPAGLGGPVERRLQPRDRARTTSAESSTDATTAR